MKSKHDKHWRRTFCDLKRGKVSRRAIRHFVRRICALVARLGEAFGAPRPGGEFVAFVRPTQEPDLRDLDGGLLTPEACSG